MNNRSEELPLTDMNAGEKGVILKIKGDSILRKRLLDMGLTRGALIEVIRRAPLGDPIEFLIKNYHLTLRKKDGKQVIVRRI